MYEALKCFNLDDQFIGWAIVDHVPKGIMIEGTWLYLENEIDELNKKLEFLNEAELIKQNWPPQEDPEVQEILSREDFAPAEMEHMEVIDETKSNVVFDDDEEINYRLSDITYKTVLTYSPAAAFERINSACEVVARERAGLTHAS